LFITRVKVLLKNTWSNTCNDGPYDITSCAECWLWRDT